MSVWTLFFISSVKLGFYYLPYTFVTMGVDLVTYRLRIGCHVARAFRCKHEKVVPYVAKRPWDSWTRLTVKMILATTILFTAFAGSMMFPLLTSSHFAQGFLGAFSIEKTRAVTFFDINMPWSTMYGYNHDRLWNVWPTLPSANTGMSKKTAGNEKQYLPNCARCLVSAYSEYEFDLSSLLILGGDVESNPGPVEREDLDALLQKLTTEMAMNTTKIREDISKLNDRMLHVEQELSQMKSKIETHEEWIDHMSDRTHELCRRVDELEKALEDQEVRSRRDNVILYGIPESEHEAAEKSEEKFRETVNSVLDDPLRESDVVRAHRIGKREEGKTRPLIARLAISTLKHSILQKRKELKERRIGVSADLTVNQRKQIQQANQEGKFAFFKGRVLHTEERRFQPRSDQTRPVTRSSAKASRHSER